MPSDISPEFSTVIGMSAILYFAVMGVIGVPLAFVSTLVLMATVFLVGLGFFVLLYRHFISSNNWKRIIKSKPVIKNRKVSIVITLAFFIVGMLCAVCGPFVMKRMYGG